MDNDEVSLKLDDLVRYLPAPLRDNWVVIPKPTIHKTLVASTLVGAASALLITGIILGIDSLKWFFPAVLAAMSFATKFVPWWREDRLIDQLRSASVEDGA